ncbi:MAG: hypothetical protein ACWA5P_00555 [bacterium]
MKLVKTVISLAIIVICSSCVQETHLKKITFKVDMTEVDSIINPGVKGQFSSPSWEVMTPLTDNDNDGIYEATVELQAAHYGINFKFVNNDEYELEIQNNRLIKFEYEPQNITYSCIFNNAEGEQQDEKIN